MNPFFIAGYGGPEYFCDREEETSKLIGALKNGRNVAFISPRRLGKTGLIQHTFQRMKLENPEVRCFYMDIFPTQSQVDFIKLFAQTVLGKLDSLTEMIMTDIVRVLKHCRPLLSVDALSGLPTMTLDVQPGEAEASLKDIIDYLERSGHPCYVAIDEFQQITEYPEQGTDALLRSHIQFTKNVHFIFAGSRQHLMSRLFLSPSQPFFQSVQKMGLTPLDRDVYCRFAQQLMNRGGKKLPSEVFEEAYLFARGYTWYIQDLMNRLYELPDSGLTADHLHGILQEVKAEGETVYKSYCELLSRGQLRLLRAIAEEDIVKMPFEHSFINRHRLTAVSSVKLALDSLTKSNILAKTDDGYYIYDRYLSLWLRSR